MEIFRLCYFKNNPIFPKPLRSEEEKYKKSPAGVAAPTEQKQTKTNHSIGGEEMLHPKAQYLSQPSEALLWRK
jgi:hypothetical protein